MQLWKSAQVASCAQSMYAFSQAVPGAKTGVTPSAEARARGRLVADQYADQQALLTGDVAHHPCQMAHLDWSSTADSDPVQSIEARKMLFSHFADTPTLVFGGHYDPGHIVRDGEAFRLIAATKPS